jgi:hypothetical protein
MTKNDVILLHLIEGSTVIGYRFDQDEKKILVGYPVVIETQFPGRMNTAVYGYQYSLFSEESEVTFFISGMSGISTPDSRISEYYEKLVQYYQNFQLNIEPSDKLKSVPNPDQEEDDEEEKSGDAPGDKSEEETDTVIDAVYKKIGTLH